jgi:valyl-tRNA synthetase
LIEVLRTTLNLLHPFMPFITEELWHKIQDESPTIMKAPWPEVDAGWIDADAEALFGRLQALVTEARNIRSTFRVPVKQQITLLVRAKKGTELFSQYEPAIKRFATVDKLTVDPSMKRPEGAVVAHLPEQAGFDAWDLIVPLAGLVDLSVEKQRIEKEMKDIRSRADAKKTRLQDETFRANAPAEIVAEMEDSLKELESELSKWAESLKQLQ